MSYIFFSAVTLCIVRKLGKSSLNVLHWSEWVKPSRACVCVCARVHVCMWVCMRVRVWCTADAHACFSAHFTTCCFFLSGNESVKYLSAQNLTIRAHCMVDELHEAVSVLKSSFQRDYWAQSRLNAPRKPSHVCVCVCVSWKCLFKYTKMALYVINIILSPITFFFLI